MNVNEIIRAVGPLTAAKLVAEVSARHPDARFDTSEFPIQLDAEAAARLEAGIDSALLANERLIRKRALVLPQHDLVLLESLTRVGFRGMVFVHLPMGTTPDFVADVQNNIPHHLEVQFQIPPALPAVTPAEGYVLLVGISVGAGYFRFPIAALDFVSIYRSWFSGEIILIDPVVGTAWTGVAAGWATKHPSQIGVTKYLMPAVAA